MKAFLDRYKRTQGHEIYGGMYKNLVSRLPFSCSYKVTRLYSPSPLVCQLHIQELHGPTHFNYQFLFDTVSTALMASSVCHLDLVAGVITYIPQAAAGGGGGGDGNAFLVSLSLLYIRSGATSKSVSLRF